MPSVKRATTPTDLVPGIRKTALLFDWDGTLFDNHHFNFAVLGSALDQHGVVITEEWFHQNSGFSARKIIELAGGENGIQLDAQEVLASRNTIAELRVGEIAPIVPVHALVHAHYGKLALAVVTGSDRSNIAALLAYSGLEPYLDTIVTRDELSAGKPDPEGYRLAMQRLSVEPEQALVYEDSEQGIEAALAAGIDVIDVRQIVPSS